MRRQSKNKRWKILFGLLLAASLVWLPTFIAKLKVLHMSEDRIVLELTDVAPYENYSSIAIISCVLRNEGQVMFDRMEGNLRISRNGEILYSCHASYHEKVAAGEEKTLELTVSNLTQAKPLLSCPVSEMRYSWKLTSVRFRGFGFLFTQDYGSKNSVPWMIIGWSVLALCTLICGILAYRNRKIKKEAGSEEPREAGKAYSSGSFFGGAFGLGPEGSGLSGASFSAASSGKAPGKTSYGDHNALKSAQKSLEYASWQAASYRSQGLAENAETQEHFKRAAFGDVLRESARLSGEDQEKFRSAQKSYERASRLEASYRAGGLTENAENARYRRETAYRDMLQAIAEKDGRHSNDFDRAKRSYEYESHQAASYRTGGSKDNSLEAEHRMRVAYGKMLKNTSDLGRKESEEYSRAQNSYEHASRQAASFRSQGLTQNAERSEHEMRVAEAKMLKVKAEAKGNSRAFDDARKQYENASWRYSNYMSQGLEDNARREKDYMDRAYAKMMQNV